MADPTLKDVLDAVKEVKADVKALKGDVAEVRADLARVEATMKKGFADLDEELTRHSAVHREIEKDITVSGA